MRVSLSRTRVTYSGGDQDLPDGIHITLATGAALQRIDCGNSLRLGTLALLVTLSGCGSSPTGPQLGDEAGFRAVESWVFNISCPNCNDEQSNGLRRARDEIESSGCDFAGALVSAFDDLMSQGRIGIATYRDVGGDHGPLAHRSGLGYDIEFGTDMWGDGPPQRFPEWTWENTLNVVAHELTHHIYTNLFGETCSRSNGGCHDDPPADGWPTVHEVAEDCGGLAWSNDDGGDYHAN